MTRTVRLDRKPNILYSNDAVSSKRATRHNFQEALHTKTRQEQRILPLLRRVVVGCYCSDNIEEVERGGGGGGGGRYQRAQRMILQVGA